MAERRNKLASFFNFIQRILNDWLHHELWMICPEQTKIVYALCVLLCKNNDFRSAVPIYSAKELIISGSTAK